MKINFTDVPDVLFEPVPPDTYIVTIADGEIKESGEDAKHPGTPYIKWDMVISQGEYAGRHIFTNTSLWPDSLQYGLKPLLKATGKFNTDGELDFEIPDVLNSQIAVKVNIKKQEGYDDQNNVRRFMSLDDAAETMASTGSTSLLPGQ